jgi:hypothetical protein
MTYILIAIIFYLAGIATVVIPSVIRQNREAKIESGFERYKKPQRKG